MGLKHRNSFGREDPVQPITPGQSSFSEAGWEEADWSGFRRECEERNWRQWVLEILWENSVQEDKHEWGTKV